MNPDPQQLTIIGMLLAIGAAGLKKAWVFGWVLADKQAELETMTTDRDFWRDSLLASLGHTDKAIEVVAKATRK